MIKIITSTAALLLASALPTIASAQATPDITDAINQGSRVEDARRAQETTNIGRRADGDEEIDGEAGIYVLTVNDIFYVAGGVGGGWAENPLRTVDDVGDSFFANAAITAGIQTKIAEKVDFGASATVSGIEYEQGFAPSSRTVTGAINAGIPIAGTPLYVGISAFGGRSFDSDFTDGAGFYGANAQVSAGVPLGPNTFARATLSGGRNENQIEENNNWNASLGFDLTQVVSEDFSVGAQARVTRTWFDDFFEDVTFAQRNDWQYGAGVNANWSPYSWLSVSASAGYEQRDSGFFLSSYNGFETSLNITARKRF